MQDYKAYGNNDIFYVERSNYTPKSIEILINIKYDKIKDQSTVGNKKFK